VHQKAPSNRREAGNSTLEYVGAVGLAAILVISLLGVWFHSDAIKIMTTAYCKVSSAVGLGHCASVDLSEPSGLDGGTDDGDDQPWYCDWFGIGCHKDNGGNDGDDQPWYCDLFGIGCHKDNVDIPPELDSKSDLVKTLLSTQRGRDTLQWLYDNKIPIVVDPDTTGAYWNGTQIVMGEGYDDASVLVHETNHAKYTKDGRSADVHTLDRDAYVTAAINEEVDGTVQQILAAKEFRSDGRRVDNQPAEVQYDAAYQNTKDRGGSDAEAQQAGSEAVRKEFYHGGLVTSTTKQSYPDLYGEYWDREH
jgi:hypothetical protein